MTPAALDAQLHHLRRVIGPVTLWGGVVVASLEALVIVTTFRAHPPNGHDLNALPYYGIGFIACCVPIVVWYFALRQLFAKLAPKCDRCGHAVSLLERDRILSTGKCPTCGHTLVAADPNGA